MSDYHIMEIGPKGDSARVAFHFPIPLGATNQAGRTYRSAYKQFRDPDNAGIESAIPDLSTTHALEHAAITVGETVELVETVNFSANASNASKVQSIEDKWTELNSDTLTKIQGRLLYWGHSADVN
jgi:hypothetical protein